MPAAEQGDRIDVQLACHLQIARRFDLQPPDVVGRYRVDLRRRHLQRKAEGCQIVDPLDPRNRSPGQIDSGQRPRDVRKVIAPAAIEDGPRKGQDRAAARRLDNQMVVPRAAEQLVRLARVPGKDVAAVQFILPGPAIDRVSPGPAIAKVVAAAKGDRVGPIASNPTVGRIAKRDRIVVDRFQDLIAFKATKAARRGRPRRNRPGNRVKDQGSTRVFRVGQGDVQRVEPGAALHVIDTPAFADFVIAAAAAQDVIAASPADRVGVLPPDDPVRRIACVDLQMFKVGQARPVDPVDHNRPGPRRKFSQDPHRLVGGKVRDPLKMDHDRVVAGPAIRHITQRQNAKVNGGFKVQLQRF